jgi:serine/threonine protein kinase
MLGRYRLLERLGAGGMAVVYRAVIEGPKGFSRPFVIKRILPSLARDESFVNMLLTEARVSAMLHHPNIVQVHELGEVEGEYFLAMEYVDGADLSTIIRACKQRSLLPPAEVVAHILAELLSALSYAHSLSDETGLPLEIVHRDVSPSNIMLTSNGGVKLLDFGIAKAANHVRDEHTRTGTLKGKLSYLSPEQAEGLFVDRRTDIFALGIVIHEALVMKRLFRGSDDFQTLRHVREAKVLSPSTLRPGLDRELDAVVMRMLARDADERFASCEDVLVELRPIVHRLHGDAQALKRFLAGLGPMERRNQPVDEADVPIALTPISQIQGTPSRTSGEMRPVTNAVGPPRRGVWVGAGAGALVGAIILAFLLRPPAAEPQRAPSPVAPIAPIAAAAPPQPAPRAKVHLVVLGPTAAEVQLDGRLVGRIPLDVELPRVPASRRVTVLKPGRLPYAQDIAGDDDTMLNVTLRKPAVAPVRRVAVKPHHEDEVKDPFAQ